MTISNLAKIYAVDNMSALITRTESAWLIIHAIGRTATTSWSGGLLSQCVYLTPPSDGIQEYDFLAEQPKPDAPVLNVLTPISAHIEVPNKDIENYWGKGNALKGIRTNAVSNTKTVVVSSKSTAEGHSDLPPSQASVRYVIPVGSDGVPSFDEVIKPLFRPDDVSEMILWGGFNLHKYEDVKANAKSINDHLNLDMPCDGLWPMEDRELFAKWKDGGMPA